jgi:MFS superfamily sulfate permease-like transporter
LTLEVGGIIMEIGELYQFVLILVLVGMITGVGILVLDKFSTSSGVTPAAQTALNASRDAVSSVATDWLALIVTIGVLAIILFLVIRSFVAKGR